MISAKYRSSLLTLLLLGSASLITPEAVAKPGAGRGVAAEGKKKDKDNKKDKVGGNAAERRTRMQERRGHALEEAGITEDRAKQVLDATRPLDQERLALQGKLMEKRQALRKLIEAGSKDEAAYAPLITDLRNLERSLSGMREKELNVVAKILKPNELARLLLARGWSDQRGRRGDDGEGR